MCATVDITVDESRAAPVPEAFTGVLPVEGVLWLPDRRFPGGVVVSVADGWLVQLEVYHVHDEPVREFPGPGRLEVVPADPGA